MIPSQSDEMLVLNPTVDPLILGSLFFGGGGLFCMATGPLFVGIVGVLGVAMGLASLCLAVWTKVSPKSRLRLSPSGFTFGTFQAVSSYNWNEVEKFHTLKLSWAGGERVGFTFAPSCQRKTFIRWLNPPLPMGLLPRTYGKQPVELALLLETWRQKYGNIQHN